MRDRPFPPGPALLLLALASFGCREHSPRHTSAEPQEARPTDAVLPTWGDIDVIAIGGRCNPNSNSADADETAVGVKNFADMMHRQFRANVTTIPHATRAAMLAALKQTIRHLPADDTLVLLFSGGCEDVGHTGGREPALLPIDASADGGQLRAESVVTLSEFRACLAAAPPTNQVVVMDFRSYGRTLEGVNIESYFANGVTPENCATNLAFVGIRGDTPSVTTKGGILLQGVTDAFSGLGSKWRASGIEAPVRAAVAASRDRMGRAAPSSVVVTVFTLGQDFLLTLPGSADTPNPIEGTSGGGSSSPSNGTAGSMPFPPESTGSAGSQGLPTDRGNVVRPLGSSDPGVNGKSYALIIETETYDDKKDFHDLPNPPVDAAHLTRVLEAECGFEPVVTLRHPTKNQIADALRSYRKLDIGRNDQLLVYVAGHGALDEDDPGLGYLVLKETVPSPSYDRYLQYDDLLKWVNIASLYAAGHGLNGFRHVCLMVDACYDGSFFRCVRVGGNLNVSENDDSSALAICSVPGDRPASDGFPGKGSPFALAIEKLLRAIKPGDSLDAEGLEGGLKRELPNTKPLHGPILGRATEGEFTFYHPARLARE